MHECHPLKRQVKVDQGFKDVEEQIPIHPSAARYLHVRWTGAEPFGYDVPPAKLEAIGPRHPFGRGLRFFSAG